MNQQLQPLFNLDAAKGRGRRIPKWPRCPSGGSSIRSESRLLNTARKLLTKVIPKSIKRFIRRRFLSENYWAERQHMQYYQQVLRLARKYAPDAKTVIDVGPATTPFLVQIDWILSKTAIDLEFEPSIPGATNIHGDFMCFEPGDRFDLVLCLQVLKHLDSPTPFYTKAASNRENGNYLRSVSLA